MRAIKERNRKSDAGGSLCAAVVGREARSRKEPGKERSRRRERRVQKPRAGREVTSLVELQGP